MSNGFVFADAAAEIAREAGALVRSYYDSSVATEYKGDVDLVTEADRASERLIVERFRERFPEHGIYGEEGTRKQIDGEYRWYVDPLDGTTNFAHRFPVFCVSLGLERRPAGLAAGEDGELVAAVVYDPMRDELFTAEYGKGAYLNGKRIQVSTVAALAEGLLATGFPSRKRHENPNIHFYNQITLRSHGVRRAGSAALDLAYTACGRFDGYWEFNLNPWDTAAGALLVTEAGGTVTRFDGSPYRLDSREVLATNGLMEREVIALFQDMFAGRGLDPIPTPEDFARMRAEREP
ncbi:inositol monophosphatase family protein [Acidipila rosea]|uniref:Inositol-1-monophosphatase n=1 Tax=Acidipila rosea TaxID=768535 RepID=A0A4R1L516_9BACT|nr:inositol monophosphatase family protein [Acidipila rosea]MBW4027872.1 inositol monophosphatase [Acidobacteriota bacterium]MBW4045245.1 inositol monophosphatase [Acidobacteriota bacterium]TCK72083.1 myo-inositol-1(or 4)-monophosphatase [Acidipila rosea]